MSALDQIFASNPKDALHLITIELHHPAFSPETHRFVQGFGMINAYLESDAPRDAGQEVVFTDGAFKIGLPAKNVRGRQDLTCTLYGPSLDIVEQLELMAQSSLHENVTIILREYDSRDLSEPDSVLKMVVSNPIVKNDSVTFSASFADVVNKSFPSIFYKLETHPGLA